MFAKKDPLAAELFRLTREENRFLEKRREKKPSALNRLLEEKAPEKLQEALASAFAKAFALVFEKGTGIIELSYNRDKKEKQFKIDSYAASIRGDKKSLRSFSKKAGSAGALNLAMSGAAVLGLGVLGIGLPDIALFTGLMLKSVYETALSFGFEYDSEEEKKFILRLIAGAMAYGEELLRIDAELNTFIESGRYPLDADKAALTKQAAAGLSGELLCMKFLQGLPIVGALGGAYDAVYMKRINDYARLKYRRRFYEKLRRN